MSTDCIPNDIFRGIFSQFTTIEEAAKYRIVCHQWKNMIDALRIIPDFLSTSSCKRVENTIPSSITGNIFIGLYRDYDSNKDQINSVDPVSKQAARYRPSSAQLVSLDQPLDQIPEDDLKKGFSQCGYPLLQLHYSLFERSHHRVIDITSGEDILYPHASVTYKEGPWFPSSQLIMRSVSDYEYTVQDSRCNTLYHIKFDTHIQHLYNLTWHRYGNRIGVTFLEPTCGCRLLVFDLQLVDSNGNASCIFSTPLDLRCRWMSFCFGTPYVYIRPPDFNEFVYYSFVTNRVHKFATIPPPCDPSSGGKSLLLLPWFTFWSRFLILMHKNSPGTVPHTIEIYDLRTEKLVKRFSVTLNSDARFAFDGTHFIRVKHGQKLCDAEVFVFAK